MHVTYMFDYDLNFKLNYFSIKQICASLCCEIYLFLDNAHMLIVISLVGKTRIMSGKPRIVGKIDKVVGKSLLKSVKSIDSQLASVELDTRR